MTLYPWSGSAIRAGNLILSLLPRLDHLLGRLLNGAGVQPTEAALLELLKEAVEIFLIPFGLAGL